MAAEYKTEQEFFNLIGGAAARQVKLNSASVLQNEFQFE
jgi:hypothetical protein